MFTIDTLTELPTADLAHFHSGTAYLICGNNHPSNCYRYVVTGDPQDGQGDEFHYFWDGRLMGICQRNEGKIRDVK